MLILYAINLHSGGGKVLLDEMIVNCPFGKPLHLFLDYRYELPKTNNYNEMNIVKIRPRLWSRWRAEFLLKNVSFKYPDATVICFGNLPPMWKLAGNTVTYLQNAHSVPGSTIPKYSMRVFFRIIYERLIWRIFIRNTDEIWVQTNFIKELFPEKITPMPKVKPVIPVFPKLKNNIEKSFDYILITGCAPYKRLIEFLIALESLNNTFPKLFILSDGITSKIKKQLARLKKKGFYIEYQYNKSREYVFNVLLQSRCLIVTSELESFCLPLYEAMHFDLHILAIKATYIEFSYEKLKLVESMEELINQIESTGNNSNIDIES